MFYRNGSVIVDFAITVATSSNTAAIVFAVQTSAQAGAIGNLSVDANYTFIGRQGGRYRQIMSIYSNTAAIVFAVQTSTQAGAIGNFSVDANYTFIDRKGGRYRQIMSRLYIVTDRPSCFPYKHRPRPEL